MRAGDDDFAGGFFALDEDAVAGVFVGVPLVGDDPEGFRAVVGVVDDAGGRFVAGVGAAAVALTGVFALLVVVVVVVVVVAAGFGAGRAAAAAVAEVVVEAAGGFLAPAEGVAARRVVVVEAAGLVARVLVVVVVGFGGMTRKK